ncbi:MAG: hypothetical protein K8T20_05050 [Planctomycetes bacterium]|nr:hypothetical protein [Planctomycetota bacterium]
MRLKLATFALACAVSIPLAAEPLDDGKDHSADLAKAMEEAVAGTKESRAAFVKQLVLPDASAWLARAFGEKPGARGAEAYEKMAKGIDKVDAFFEGAAKAEATKAKVTRIVEAPKPGEEDPSGAGEILAWMKEKAALYAVMMVRADGVATKRTFDIGFFVWSAGAPRLVGSFRGAVVRAIECKNQLKQLTIYGALYESGHRRLAVDILDLITKNEGAKESELLCPCFPEDTTRFHYVYPILDNDTGNDVITFFCTHVHGGRRQYATFGGAVTDLPTEEFDKRLKSQYEAGLKALPACRERLKKIEVAAEAADFEKGLNGYEAEAKAALGQK